MLAALLSGMLLVLSFPLFDFSPLAWIALVPLLITLRERDSRESFSLGIMTGFVYFAGTIYWVYHSMYYYGNVPLIFSVLLLMVLSLILSLYTGIFAMLFCYCVRRSSVPGLFTAPLLWVTLEYVRTYALTGFPWSVLGYSQYTFLPLIQISDITGVYGISFLVAASNGAIYDLAVRRRVKSSSVPRLSRGALAVSVSVFIITLALCLFYGVGKLKEEEQGQKFRVSVVQGNIAQDKKWDSRFQREVIDTYMQLTLKALSQGPDIIVWPESALPFIFQYDRKFTEEIIEFQKEIGTRLLFGSVVVKTYVNDRAELTNSAVLLSPDSEKLLVYDKIHLVPFGEYVPLKKLFPFISKLVTAIGDFVQGEEITVMKTPFANIGNLICYEIIFPGLVREFVHNGATVLATITNDAWFGRTAAPYQLFSMAVFRAVENRVPVVRAANTGISGFIDSRGRILGKSGLFVEAVLSEEITGGSRKSFYSQYGDLFAYLCILFSLGLIISRPVRSGGKQV